MRCPWSLLVFNISFIIRDEREDLATHQQTRVPDISSQQVEQEPSENENEFMTKDTVTMWKNDRTQGTFTWCIYLVDTHTKITLGTSSSYTLDTTIACIGWPKYINFSFIKISDVRCRIISSNSVFWCLSCACLLLLKIVMVRIWIQNLVMCQIS